MPLIKNYINVLPSTAIQKSVCSENYQLRQNVSTHDKCQSPIIAWKTTTIHPTFTRRTSGQTGNLSSSKFCSPSNKRSASHYNPHFFFLFFFLLILHLLSFIQNPCSNHLQTIFPVTTVKHRYTEIGVPQLFCWILIKFRPSWVISMSSI